MSNGVSITATKLAKSYDDGLVTALNGVDLEVPAGSRIALTGPTGCGKSTLLALLALLMPPDTGEVSFDGEPSSSIRSPERWRAENLGIVFQFHHLLPHLTVRENVMLAVSARGRTTNNSSDGVTSLLHRLDLEHRADTLTNKLSGGERQLTALARALVNGPRLVLADEPTGSVDSVTGQRILTELTRWTEETGGTLILATHDAAVASWAQKELRMLDGRFEGVDAGPAH